MKTEDIPLLGLLLLLIILSAYFSSSETAFSAMNRIKMKNAVMRGDRKAKRTMRLAENYDRLLSTVLIGNNIVNISATAIATALCLRIWGEAGMTVSTVALTLVILTFGEILPKSFAKRSPEKTAVRSTPLLMALTVLLAPLSWFFTRLQAAFARRGKEESSAYTEEDILTIVEESSKDGGIDAGESELIRSAIVFNDLRAEDILTPRVAVEYVDVSDSPREVKKAFIESGFSRLPVCRRSLDAVLGVVTQKDFFANAEKERLPLEKIMKPVSFITAGMPISKLLKLLQSSKAHLAVVTDAYGGTVGIVTMEDILEELVGEIYDEHDAVDEEIRAAEGGYTALGTAPADDFFEKLGAAPEAGGEEEDYSTVNGWVTARLNKIPRAGDSFTFGEWLITVTDADERKALEIAAKRRPGAQGGEKGEDGDKDKDDREEDRD